MREVVMVLGLCCALAGCVRLVKAPAADRAFPEHDLGFADRGIDAGAASDAARDAPRDRAGEGAAADAATVAPDLTAAADVRPPQPTTLTELSAARWSATCNTGLIDPCSSAIVDDTAEVVDGASSVRWRCDGCGFDNALVYTPAGKVCDLSGYTQLSLSVRTAVDQAPFAWQDEIYGNTPWLVLRDANGGTLRVEPAAGRALLNASVGQWSPLQIPLAGGDGWIVAESPGFAAAQVVSLELHVDPWGFGFTLWLDAVRFEPAPFYGC